MKKPHLTHMVTLLFCVIAFTAVAQGYPRAGARAELMPPFAHNVSGTATIVNSNTIRMDDFNFDGFGIAVYLYLGTNRTHSAFAAGVPISTNLLGTAFSNDTFTVSLPAGQSLDDYNAISVWCVPAQADFGSGTFQPHITSINSSNGVVNLSVSGAPGQSYQLQGATNVVDWADLDLQTNTTGTVNLTDPEALPSRVYRVEVQ